MKIAPADEMDATPHRMTSNAILAGAALGQLVGAGASDFVVCAGARNVPLVASLLARSRESGLRVWHHFDERTAAFFALGLAKRRRAPAAVVTTSGTAAAELLPAAVEAHYGGVPLVLVTADRPASYRGSGAPQAIEQAGIFGPYAFALDASAPDGLARLAEWRGDAPLHVNLCFDEPKSEDRNGSWSPLPGPGNGSGPPILPEAIAAFCSDREGLLVLLGPLDESWRLEVERFLLSLGCSVWAEATSGLRERAALGNQIVVGDPALPRRVLRIGGVPSLRLWRDLEEHREIPVLSVSPRPFAGLARDSELLVADRFPAIPLETREGRLGDPTPFDSTPFDAHPRSEPALVRELSRRIPSGALVYLGNSLPIREWNLAAVLDPPHPRCEASRGANGIDGQIATFLGRSEGESEAWGIFGDLTALYDLNAPALLPQLSPGRRRIVVVNNGGGRIFSRLPSMAGLSPDERRIAENRHDRRFEAWAAMWGMDYRLWRTGEPFPETEAATLVIEAIPDEEETQAFWAAVK